MEVLRASGGCLALGPALEVSRDTATLRAEAGMGLLSFGPVESPR